MRLRVGQRQGRAPRAAEQLPALDAEVRAQPLHVGDQVPGGVGLQAGVRQRAAAAALVEQHDAVARGIVIAAHGGVAAAAGAAVHDQHRLAVGVAAFLEVDLVPAADLEPLLAIGLDRGIETEPLACRHRWRSVLSLCLGCGVRWPARYGYMRAGEQGKLRRVQSHGVRRRAVLQPLQAHLAVVERLAARHAHSRTMSSTLRPGAGVMQADDDRRRPAPAAGRRRRPARSARPMAPVSPSSITNAVDDEAR